MTQVKRAYSYEASGLVFAVVISWFFPVEAAVFFVGLSVVNLAFAWILAQSRKELISSPVFADQYWTDSQLDMLEESAFYWLQPKTAVKTNRFLRVQIGVWTGAACFWLFVQWALAAVFLCFAVVAIRQRPRIDPVCWYRARVDAKDYTVSDQWEAVIEINEKLKQVRGFECREN